MPEKNKKSQNMFPSLSYITEWLNTHYMINKILQMRESITNLTQLKHNYGHPMK